MLFLVDIPSSVGDENRVIMFAHVPKTAGTSILCGRRRVGNCQLYRPHVSWGDYRQYPSFAIVRDPVDRFMSAWRDFRYRRVADANSPDHGYPIDCSPDELAQRNILSTMPRSDYENPATVQHHLLPMIHPAHGLQYVEFIARYDRLQQDLDKFCDHYQLVRFDISGERKRESRHLSDEQPSRWLKDTIYNVYQRDYELMARC